jgi:hypothetical protein
MGRALAWRCKQANVSKELGSMNAHRITALAATLALAATPAALGAAPRGSHGQETDAPAAAANSARCTTGVTPLAVRSAAFTAPRGSHGQETDRHAVSQFALRPACVAAPVAVLAVRTTNLAVTPRGSHGQETDR